MFFVKIWNEAFEDYEDFMQFDTKEEAQEEANILKKNGEIVIIESFSESSRNNDLTEEVNYYNKVYNE